MLGPGGQGKRAGKAGYRQLLFPVVRALELSRVFEDVEEQKGMEVLHCG